MADILRAAAARENIDLVFVPESPAQLTDTLSKGAADAIAPMPIGSQQYDFTTSFVTTGGALFVRAPNAMLSDVADFSGKQVITPKDGPFISFFAKNFPGVTVVPAAGAAMSDEYVASLDAVVSGQADAAALNIQEGTRVAAASYAGKITVPTTQPIGQAFAHRIPKHIDRDVRVVKHIGRFIEESAQTTGRNTTPIADPSLAVSMTLKRERIPRSREVARSPPPPIGSTGARKGLSARLMTN